MTQHLKSGIPSAKTCQLLLADRNYTVDYNLARRFVNAVLRFRREKIAKGFSEEKVGRPVVNTDFITVKSKGKLVAKLDGEKPAKKAVSKPAPQPVVHSRRSSSYGRF